jgi:hypothetical protein
LFWLYLAFLFESLFRLAADSPAIVGEMRQNRKKPAAAVNFSILAGFLRLGFVKILRFAKEFIRMIIGLIDKLQNVRIIRRCRCNRGRVNVSIAAG